MCAQYVGSFFATSFIPVSHQNIKDGQHSTCDEHALLVALFTPQPHDSMTLVRDVLLPFSYFGSANLM